MKVNVRHPGMGFFVAPVALLMTWPVLGFSDKPKTHMVTLTVYGTGLNVPIQYIENGQSKTTRQALPWVYTYRANEYEPIYLAVKNDSVENDIDVMISVDMHVVKSDKVQNQSTLGLNTYCTPNLQPR